MKRSRLGLVGNHAEARSAITERYWIGYRSLLRVWRFDIGGDVLAELELHGGECPVD